MKTSYFTRSALIMTIFTVIIIIIIMRENDYISGIATDTSITA